MPHLAVVLPAEAGAEPDQRTVDEVRALVGRWPGRVSVVLHRPAPGAAVDIPVAALSALGVDVVAGDPLGALERLGADVVRMPLDPTLTPITHRLPTVVVADSTAVQRLRYTYASGPGVYARTAGRAVHELWTARTVLGSADGLQCNGWGAWAAYHEHAQVRHSIPPLLFFDSMVTAARVATTDPRPRVDGPPDGTLRLAFVGRLHPADGPQYAVAASGLLTRWGVVNELVVHGLGPMENRLRAVAGAEVRFGGPLGEGADRMDAVETADLALLPYLHAHPTGAELELAARGVPVVGFRSSTLEGHRRFGGFTTTVLPRSARALASAARRLAHDRQRRAALAVRGVGFMSRHHAEARREAQVEHLLRAASLRSGATWGR